MNRQTGLAIKGSGTPRKKMVTLAAQAGDLSLKTVIAHIK